MVCLMFDKRYFLGVVLVVLMFTISFGYGASIKVNVADILDTTSKEIDCCELNGNVMSVSYDIFNSGSVAYSARVRLDLFDNGSDITSIWSDEYKLNPGQRDTIDMYWYESEKTKITVKPKLYRAYEIVDLENITWVFNDTKPVQNTIEFDKISVSDDKIKFQITVENETDRIIVYPIHYTKGWLFEQTVVDDITAGNKVKASILYDTGAFYENEITFVAVSSDGKYYGEKTFLLKKDTGIKKWWNQFIDLFE